MAHHDSNRKETTKPETSNSDSRKADNNELDNDDRQPSRTNLVHRLSVTLDDVLANNLGHDQDQQARRWLHFLGRIHPFYAVKCNPNGFIVRIIAEMGGGFDCASAEELDLVRATYGVDFDYATRIIFAHPCKSVSHIKQFREAGVQMTVVDNEDELKKLKEHWPEAKVLLRLKPDDKGSLSPFSTKFGANELECITLLRLARQLGVQLVGCSFHVGIRCLDAQIYMQSLRQARRLFDIAGRDEFGFDFKVLDIGGGFSGITLMSEPGRYFASGGMTLVVRIIARRIHNQDYKSQEEVIKLERSFSLPTNSLVQVANTDQSTVSEQVLIECAENIYYINDGIYGTFNAIIFDHKVFTVHYLKIGEQENNPEQYKSVIFVPTCDSIDCIAHSIDLPLLDIGDVLWFPDVGAYTSACASDFNGFKTKNTCLFGRVRCCVLKINKLAIVLK
ncbi:unnamed protein product [Rotaria magnacalcarata]|uniref:ornithine decarboxylase n=3 Tax=Rotaria magnacalcarata TaxID=392030 RepID=A0A8S2P948_9BILA|nr:unnamed protein product [Rotaria magnacalcarata]